MTTQISALAPEVTIHDGKAVTTSFSVTSYFHKRHDNVVRAIENLECSPEFTALNFEVCYKNSELQNGKPQKYYEMTKDGFVFLVMGFTGKKAVAFKEAYIGEFNRMENELNKPDATQTVHKPKKYSITLTDEELCSLCWMWSHAVRMISNIADVEPILRVAEHRLAGAYYSMAHEYPRNANEVRKILQKVTAHIECSQLQNDNWRVLNRMRLNSPHFN